MAEALEQANVRAHDSLGCLCRHTSAKQSHLALVTVSNQAYSGCVFSFVQSAREQMQFDGPIVAMLSEDTNETVVASLRTLSNVFVLRVTPFPCMDTIRAMQYAKLFVFTVPQFRRCANVLMVDADTMLQQAANQVVSDGVWAMEATPSHYMALRRLRPYTIPFAHYPGGAGAKLLGRGFPCARGSDSGASGMALWATSRLPAPDAMRGQLAAFVQTMSWPSVTDQVLYNCWFGGNMSLVDPELYSNATSQNRGGYCPPCLVVERRCHAFNKLEDDTTSRLAQIHLRLRATLEQERLSKAASNAQGTQACRAVERLRLGGDEDDD